LYGTRAASRRLKPGARTDGRSDDVGVRNRRRLRFSTIGATRLSGFAFFVFPILDIEAANARKPPDVSCDKYEIARLCLPRDEHIVRTDRRARSGVDGGVKGRNSGGER
jgi:hypothetical protein